MVRVRRLGAVLTAGLAAVLLAACAGLGVNKAGGQAAPAGGADAGEPAG
jgi:hypothetical protein